MRYAKDTLMAIALVMLVPVLLILFAMAMFILICRRLFWDMGRRYGKPGSRLWTWARSWSSRRAADADSPAERSVTSGEHHTIALADAPDLERWPVFSAERRTSAPRSSGNAVYAHRRPIWDTASGDALA
jgi:hypothetical protein